ncbi:acyl-CoA desaturase 1-like protein [Cricetulus griseus]|nr:acyl-CoA desaturase 1-like protein [Cricetulus griseus]
MSSRCYLSCLPSHCTITTCRLYHLLVKHSYCSCTATVVQPGKKYRRNYLPDKENDRERKQKEAAREKPCSCRRSNMPDYRNSGFQTPCGASVHYSLDLDLHSHESPLLKELDGSEEVHLGLDQAAFSSSN